jgi:hypothetical protein
MHFGEVALGILRLLLIGRLGHLENLIYKTLKLVTVLGLVLSPGMINANVIQEALELTRPRPILLMVTRLFYHINRMVQLSLLVVALR